MKRIVYFDIDDTIVRSFGQKRIPMPAVIAQIRKLKAAGTTLYLWSSGGAEYCKSTALEFGITDCFDGFLPKPTFYVDDQPMHEWRLCQHLYPAQIDEMPIPD